MTRRILISIFSIAFVASSVASAREHQAAGVAGIWKLNEAESNNPNGPAPPQGPKERRPDAGKDMTGGASRSAAPQQASELSNEEKARINKMLGLFNHAAQTLEIIVEGTDMTIKQDGTGFPKQNADGKKFALRNPQIGEVDIKIKVDAKGMTREVTTQEDLKIVENYALSADGKMLTVTMKASQPVMKIEDAKVKRVYYRQ